MLPCDGIRCLHDTCPMCDEAGQPVLPCRICRMIESPVVGTISSMLFSFNSRSQSYLENFPHFVGGASKPQS